MYKEFAKSVEGNHVWGEKVSVTTTNYYAFAEIAEADLNVVELKVRSNGNIVNADLTIENAKQLAQHLLDAVEFLENT